jgi:hypothetical protein
MSRRSLPLPELAIPIPDLFLDSSDHPHSLGRSRTMSDVSVIAGLEDEAHIDPEGLRDLIRNFKSYDFDNLLIVDARFAYEWDYGHIDKSWNIRSFAAMQKLYREFRECRSCMVVHCEKSVDRGPRLIRAFRSFDRESNKYPVLSYPTLYLLDGGYKRFYRECADLCIGGYRPMDDPEFVQNGILKQSHTAYVREMVEPSMRPRLQRSHSCVSPMIEFDYIFKSGRLV